jgi:hypothetical protein
MGDIYEAIRALDTYRNNQIRDEVFSHLDNVYGPRTPRNWTPNAGVDVMFVLLGDGIMTVENVREIAYSIEAFLYSGENDYLPSAIFMRDGDTLVPVTLSHGTSGPWDENQYGRHYVNITRDGSIVASGQFTVDGAA